MIFSLKYNVKLPEKNFSQQSRNTYYQYIILLESPQGSL